MKRIHFALAGLALAMMPPFSSANETIADILSEPGLNLDRPADRAQAVQRIRAVEMANRDRAHAKARAMGQPTRYVLPNGTVHEIVGLDENGEFLIYTTHNANAAISSAANLVYPAPYNLDGTGITVGVWDESAVRVTHTEFLNQAGTASRVTVRDGATTLSSHATHVAGTVNARGASISRKGMAPNALVDSYDWFGDNNEMTAAGASSPQQAGKITISNHSYGFGRGWGRNAQGVRQWYGTGTDQNAYAIQFGQYNTFARDWDTLAFNAPYYLIFKSAGNDNSDNPSNGENVVIGGNTVSYNSSIHPLGDGMYRGGYENIGDNGNSKNIMTVGAVNDAVSGGLRSPANGTIASFSSRGPTDDGRIKPDIVANGVTLSSTWSTGDTAYNSISGTSMSSPSAAGSAALLVQLYRNLFPGGDMRASTLKGLIIHTATDIGNPGPDYHYGWGLMNTKEAADLIIDHHENPSANRMVEDLVSTSDTIKTYPFNWDGISPIRATICWTDPAGQATSTHDLRTPRLVNDLDLKIIAPDGTQYYPYVMPFVGTWTVASMSAHATTGVNSTDNVEQVFIQNPGQSGTWQVEVSYKGSLTNNQQDFSLLTSGLSAAPLSMEVARGESILPVNGIDGVGGTGIGSATALTYTILNVGGGELELTTPVTISGQSNCSVTVNTQPTSPVAGGESTNLVLSVTPAAGGTWSFGVSIANNDPDKNPHSWTVTGIAGSSATASFTPIADTYIHNQNAGANYGTLNFIYLNNQSGGGPPSSHDVVRGLLRFDLSSVPSDATIESATLDFVQDNNNSGQVNIVEATASWGETTANWSNSNGIYGGTSYGSANTGTTAGAAIPTITMNSSGLAKVQSWVNNPSGNHGFGITTNLDGRSQSAWLALRSREHPTEAHRPRLTLSYAGASADAPLMTVSGNNGFIPNSGTDSISGSVEGVASELTYTINNFGNADLALTMPITVTPVTNCSISVTSQPSSPVAASGSTDVVLSITPTAAGSWSATVSIASNDADKNPYAWTISGSAFGSHTVTYDGNTNDTGSPPTDPNSPYLEGATVTVLGNTGALSRSDFTFVGWNTAANGSGTTYEPGEIFTMPGAAVTLYAIWNAAPVVDAGPDQTVKMTESVPWTPAMLTTAAWYDASDTNTLTLAGNKVSQWRDKSGNNRHVNQGTDTARPVSGTRTMNGLNALAFSGSETQWLRSTANIANQPLTAFAVAAFDSAGTDLTVFDGAGSARCMLRRRNADRLSIFAGSWMDGTATSAEAMLASVVFNGASSSIRKNGGNASTGNPGAGNLASGLTIGNINSPSASWRMDGLITELVFVSGTISDDDRHKVEGYLAHKWGLEENLPANHPYRNAAPGSPTAVAILDGTATDPEGDPVTTAWTKVDGPPAAVEFADAAALDTTATFFAEGVYTLRLTANDGLQSAFDDVIITVEATGVVATYTVSYDGNGNTGGTAPSEQIKEENVDLILSDEGTLVRTGYSFAGWNTAADGSGTAYAGGATYSGNADITLFAQWAANTYTVTFNANGGNAPSPATKQVTFDSTYGTLATISRTGYTFLGWFTDALEGTEVTPSTMVTAADDHTLYARWIGEMVDPETPHEALPIFPGHQDWKLVFSDEFNGETVDTTKWNIGNSTNSRAARTDRGINKWFWKPENVRVENGNLVLDVTKHDHETMHCGEVNSRGKFEQLYGYFEARVQVGDTTKDTHTAFWLHNDVMTDGTPPSGNAHNGAEIDIFESAWFGDYTKSVVHIDGYGAQKQANTKQYSTPGLHDGYNVFGLEWSASYMKIYYNGEHKVTYDGMWVPWVKEFIRLSNGASFGDIGTFLQEDLGWLTSAKFDYVRVWEATANQPPAFTVDPMERPLAIVGEAYNDTIAGSAIDPELDPLTYSKVSGPAWLNVATDGSLSGTPSSGDRGTNTWTVQVMDSEGGIDQATLQITVQNPEDPRLLVGGALLNGDFNAAPGETVTFANTPVWHNTRGEQTQVATRSDVTYDGTQNATLHTGRGFGVDTGYTIVEGNLFDFSYVWKDDLNWVGASGQVMVSLFVTDDNTLTGNRTDLVVDYSGIRQVANAYEAVSREQVYTATAADAGKTLFAAIETDSAGFARIDNFELIVIPFVLPNDPPVVDAGPDQTVFLVDSHPWTPAQITTAAWYDASDASTITASGGAVSQWDDKSGNGNHAVQGNAGNRPTLGTTTIGGKDAISFRLANLQALTAPNDASLRMDDAGGVNVFSVMTFGNYVDHGSGLNVALSKGQLLSASTSYGIRVGNNSLGYQAGAPDGQINSSMADGTTLLFSGVRRDSEQTAELYFDGELVGDRINTEAIVSNNNDPLHIGRDSSGSRHSNVDFGEILIVPGELSSSDRQQLEGYLAHKWELAANLPAGHPYQAAAPGETSATANLLGAATDPENDPLTILWTLTNGPAPVSFADPSDPQTTATFTVPGTYILRLTASDGVHSSFDECIVTVYAPVDSFAISGIPAQVTVGSELSGINLTALDTNQNTATVFNSTVTYGGTAGITGESAAFVDGVLSGLSITPEVVGSNLTFTVDDGDGNTGSVSFDVISVYDDWSESSGLTGDDALPGAILQPDGLTNLQKFAFGMDPTVAYFDPVEFVPGGEMTAAGSPTLVNMAEPGQPDEERAVFTRVKNHAAAGLTYTVEFSADLKLWTTSDAIPTVLTDENSTGDHEVVSVPFSHAVPIAEGGDPHPAKFMRVTVSMD